MSARPNEARLSSMEDAGHQSRRQLELHEKPKRQRLPPLNFEQEAAIRDYAAKHGRCWKSILNNVWMGCAPYDDGGILRGLRNTHGPSWLQSYRLPKARVRSQSPISDNRRGGDER